MTGTGEAEAELRNRATAYLAAGNQPVPVKRRRDASVLERAMIVLSRSKKAAVVLPLPSTDVPTVRQHRGRDQIPMRFGMTGW